mmetsp:Transcript_51821/g.152723  ORF Transcript_51821/g.152723 Transcript_51821/m.152723 type:complete len:273 (+) Transcript_51821:273-1091(+)
MATCRRGGLKLNLCAVEPRPSPTKKKWLCSSASSHSKHLTLLEGRRCLQIDRQVLRPEGRMHPCLRAKAVNVLGSECRMRVRRRAAPEAMCSGPLRILGLVLGLVLAGLEEAVDPPHVARRDHAVRVPPARRHLHHGTPRDLRLEPLLRRRRAGRVVGRGRDGHGMASLGQPAELGQPRQLLLEGAVVVDDAAVGPTRAVLAGPDHPLRLLGVLPQAADQRCPDVRQGSHAGHGALPLERVGHEVAAAGPRQQGPDHARGHGGALLGSGEVL